MVVGNFDLSMNIVFVYDLSTDFLMHYPFRISQCFPFSVGRMDLNVLKILCSFNPYGRGQNQAAATTPPIAAARTKP